MQRRPWTGAAKEQLDLNAPEGRIRIGQGDPDIPSFMAAPNDFALSAAACFWDNQTNFAAEGKISADNGHAAGVTDIDGDGIGLARLVVFFPLDLKSEAGDSPLVRAQFCPAIF